MAISSFSEVRKKYPQYDQIPDGELSFKLWSKYYKDRVPMGEFASLVKMNDDQFGQMIAYGKSLGYEPTTKTYAEGVTPEEQKLLQFFEGQTINFGDEGIAAITATLESLKNIVSGRSPDWLKTYKTYKAELLSSLKEYQKNSPVESTMYEIAGGFVSPLILYSGPKPLIDLYNKGGRLTRSAITGLKSFAGGAAYGAGSAESMEDVIERATTDGLVSLFTTPVGTLVTSTLRKLKKGSFLANGFDEMSIRPTLEKAKDNIKKAYDLLDESGFKFKSDDFQTAYIEALQSVDEKALTKIYGNLDPKTNNPYERALLYLNEQSLLDQTPSNMERVRQQLWKFATDPQLSQADRDSVKQIYYKISQFVDNSLPKDGEGKTLADAARLAASQYKKAKLASDAFTKAAEKAQNSKDPVEVYRKAVQYLLNNQEVKDHFTEEQIKQLEKLAKGNFTRDFRQMVGRYAPSSNNMLMLMHGFGFMMDPTFLAITAGTTAAQRSVRKELGEEAFDLISDLTNLSKEKAQVLPPLFSRQVGLGATMAYERPEAVDEMFVTPLP